MFPVGGVIVLPNAHRLVDVWTVSINQSHAATSDGIESFSQGTKC